MILHITVRKLTNVAEDAYRGTTIYEQQVTLHENDLAKLIKQIQDMQLEYTTPKMSLQA